MKATFPVYLAILAIFIATNLNAQTTRVYTDDFMGESATLEAGEYDYITLVKLGITVVRSLEIPEGYQVKLYEKDNFSGNSVTLTGRVSYSYIKSKGFGSLMQNTSLRIELKPLEANDLTSVIIFADNFSGAYKVLKAGNFNVTDITAVGNDKISSLKIPSGFKVTIFEHANFVGRKQELTKDCNQENLTLLKFNDFTSSLIVEAIPVKEVKEVVKVEEKEEPKPEPTEAKEVEPDYESFVQDATNLKVILYKGEFNGSYLKVGKGKYDSRDLGNLDNQVSSIRIPDGLILKVYELPGFKGKSIVLTSHTSSEQLTTALLIKTISSFIVEELPRVVIYDGNYESTSQVLETGYYNYSDITIGNDAISSITLTSDYWILLFEDENYKGKALLLTENATNEFLKGKEFNNSVSSFIIGRKSVGLPTAILLKEGSETPLATLIPGEYPFLKEKNDLLASIKIPYGYKVTLYEKAGFEGSSVVITKSITSDELKKFGLYNAVSSLKVEMRNPKDLYVTIYSEQFKGLAHDLLPGKYLANELGIGDNQLTSIKIPEGLNATLYQDNFFKGSYLSINQSSDYTHSAFNNSISSLIVEDSNEPVFKPDPTIPVVEKEPEVKEKEVVFEKGDLIEVKNQNCMLTEFEFESAVKAIESKSFSDEKLAIAIVASKEKCLTNTQIRTIAKLFSYDDHTLEFLKNAYPLASEKSTYYLLEDLFTFSSTRETFLKFLNK